MVAEGYEPRGFQGFASYSIVLSALEQVNPQIVQLRRSGSMQTDFAVKPLKKEEEALVLDVTAFTEEVTSALSEAILSGVIRSRLGDFEVVRVEVEEVRPYRGDVVRKFSVKFRTPTFFRPGGGVKGGVFIPVPLPDRMLINLHRVWNRYLGPMEDEDEREEFHNWLKSWGIVISALKIKTLKYEDEGDFKVGFVGWAHFSANSHYERDDFLRKVDALMRLGEYVNVGGLRSKGFGVISYRKAERSAHGK